MIRRGDSAKTLKDVFFLLIAAAGLLSLFVLASGVLSWFGAAYLQDAYELRSMLPSVAEVSEKITRFKSQEARVKAVEEDMRSGWYPDKSRVKEMITEELSRGGIRISDISVKEARFGDETPRTFGGASYGGASAAPAGGPGVLDVDVRGMLPIAELYGFLAYLDGGGETSRTWTIRKMNLAQKMSAADAAAAVRSGNASEKSRIQSDLEFLQMEMTLRVVTQ